MDGLGIGGWHAHVYYDPATTKAVAAGLREAIAAGFPAALLGRWHDAPVGPHAAAMFQIAFPVALFATLVPYLALHRAGLSVLVHPETGRQRADHAAHAIWLGAALPLDLAALPE